MQYLHLDPIEQIEFLRSLPYPKDALKMQTLADDKLEKIAEDNERECRRILKFVDRACGLDD